MTVSKLSPKKTATPVEWPPAAVGSDALESLRDGNPPEALLTFARNAMGAGNHAWAIQYLRRGVDYLRYVVKSFPEVTDPVQGRLDVVNRWLVEAAATIADEETLEFSLPPDPTPLQIASIGWKLLEAKQPHHAMQWFVRARSVPMAQTRLDEHLLRFGLHELIARKNAKQVDVAFASQLVDLAKTRLAAIPPSAKGIGPRAQKAQFTQILREAEKAIASATATDATPAKPKRASSAKKRAAET